jgi:hypothetical protein
MRSGVGGAIPSCSCGAAVPCRRLYKPRNPGVAARFVELATIGVHTDLTCFFGVSAARRERSLAMSAHESFNMIFMLGKVLIKWVARIKSRRFSCF